jgi:type IV pilus assembly protein PilF
MNKAFLLGIATLFLAASCATGPRTGTVQERKADIYLLDGADALRNHQFQDALASLQKSVSYNPKSAAAWTNMGLAYLGIDELDRAEVSLKRAIALDPKWTDAKANLGALQLKTKRFAEAEKTFQDALTDLVYSRAHQIRYNLALVYMELRRPLQAEQQLKLAVRADPSYCAAWFQLGLIQKDRGDFDEAASSLAKSTVSTCFNNPQAHYEIASLLLKAKEVGRAKSKLLEVIQLFPQSDWARKAEVTLNMIR